MKCYRSLIIGEEKQLCTPGPGNTQNIRSIRTAVKEVMNVEDRRKNIILFGLEENGENASLVDMVEGVLFDTDVKPVLGSVIRLGQKSETCRPVKVSFKSSDTIHMVLKESPKLKSSAKFSKVFISIDRTPEQRVKQKENVCEMKEKIRADASKHWKISKGEVVSSEREVIPVTPAATEVKEELSSSDEEVPVTPVVTRQKAKRTANKKCSRTPSTHLSNVTCQKSWKAWSLL